MLWRPNTPDEQEIEDILDALGKPPGLVPPELTARQTETQDK